ncbi:kinase-like domain-containing protein, partial [Gautieria morchelliformis]
MFDVSHAQGNNPLLELVLSLIPPRDSEDVHHNVVTLDVFKKSSKWCLDGRITRLRSHPSGGGGFADIWEGQFGDQKVAIKTIRVFPGNGDDEDKLLKRLWREYTAWTQAQHPLVLRCLGFTYDFPCGKGNNLPSLVAPWMSNGTLNTYLKSRPETVRLKLLDVAEGLLYLHAQNPAIIHGDLRGNNVLVLDSGRPCLSDFGLSKVLMLKGMSTTADVTGSVRWMSPELLNGDIEIVNTKSDVWAYGMTVLEIVSGHVPYNEVTNDAAVICRITQGHIPSRPRDPGIADDVWGICQKCWHNEPELRPSMQHV